MVRKLYSGHKPHCTSVIDKQSGDRTARRHYLLVYTDDSGATVSVIAHVSSVPSLREMAADMGLTDYLFEQIEPIDQAIV